MKELIEAALEARNRSYCPYSGFAVGAALLCDSGEIFTGCNIENSSFGPTVCAERTAIFKAVSEGRRGFSAIAIAGGKAGEAPRKYTAPCGVCRQVMTEFCRPDMKIFLVRGKDDYREYTLEQLMPLSFTGEAL